MIIYIEKAVAQNPITQDIIASFSSPQILFIDNYKNIFDKSVGGTIEKSIIIASVNNALLDAPFWYGFSGKWYFLKNSLNCVYDCSYCYLKGAFKNNMPVFFVNYDDMKNQIQKKVNEEKEEVWFYSSDYSDNLATNALTRFVENFVPFFETLQNAKMEIRTKSVDVRSLLAFQNIQNTEIAFSLNPQEIVSKYERKTPSLNMRIQAINKLLWAGWKVWIRFLPLLEIPNYFEVYERFIDEVLAKIDIEKIHSIFIGGLMFTYEDYQKILKKEPYTDILYTLEKSNDWFVREKREVREAFYKLFWEKLWVKKCRICLDTV